MADARMYAWQQVPSHVTSSVLIQGLNQEAFRMVIINVPADNEMQQQLVERLAEAKEYLDQILKA
jgi:hypothetical protein